MFQPRNLPNLLQSAGQALSAGNLPAAEQLLTSALEIDKTEPQTLYLMGMLSFQKNDFPSAAGFLQKSLKKAPDNALVHNGLGSVYQAQGKTDKALKSFSKAALLKPDFASVYNNMGVIHKQNKRLAEAERNYSKAISIDPGFGDALNNLGFVYQDQAKITEALSCFKRAQDSGSCRSKADSNYLMCLNYSDQHSAKDVYEAHLAWGDAKTRWNGIEKCRKKEGPLKRIAYVSGDLRSHSVAYFLEGVLSNHSEDYEVYAYYTHTVRDDVTLRLEGFVTHWREVARMSDEELHAQIRRDRIDILFDLSGHTGKNRLDVFANRAAPLQVSWLGYPASTGLREIDCSLTDAFADPLEECSADDPLVHLPDSFLAYHPDPKLPDIKPAPVLKNAYITFGSFNNFSKVSESVIASWVTILSKVENSKLLLKSSAFGCPDVRKSIQSRFAESGIERNRLDFRSVVSSTRKHFEAYNEVDIALDTFPYNGTTTSFEALSMGVPVLSLVGDRHAARVGASILSNLGMEDWLAKDSEQYVQYALEHARKPEALGALRAELRSKLFQSHLCNAKAFTVNLERAMEDLWSRQ